MRLLAQSLAAERKVGTRCLAALMCSSPAERTLTARQFAIETRLRNLPGPAMDRADALASIAIDLVTLHDDACACHAHDVSRYVIDTLRELSSAYAAQRALRRCDPHPTEDEADAAHAQAEDEADAALAQADFEDLHGKLEKQLRKIPVGNFGVQDQGQPQIEPGLLLRF